MNNAQVLPSNICAECEEEYDKLQEILIERSRVSTQEAIDVLTREMIGSETLLSTNVDKNTAAADSISFTSIHKNH